MKKALIIILIVLVVLALAGFGLYKMGVLQTSRSFLFNVNTGDQISVSLKISNGYDIDSNSPFNISKDDVIVSTGTFISEDLYDQLVTSLKSQKDTIKIIEQSSRDDVVYTFYTVYNSTDDCDEFYYLMKVKNSSTGLVLRNTTSKESAQEVFNLLTLSKK